MQGGGRREGKNYIRIQFASSFESASRSSFTGPSQQLPTHSNLSFLGAILLAGSRKSPLVGEWVSEWLYKNVPSGTPISSALNIIIFYSPKVSPVNFYYILLQRTNWHPPNTDRHHRARWKLSGKTEKTWENRPIWKITIINPFDGIIQFSLISTRHIS